MLPDPEARAYQIFHPVAADAVECALRKNSQFAYYTTTTTAQLVLGGGSIWIRRTSSMNDLSEVQHGIAFVRALPSTPAGLRLQSAVDAIAPGLFERLFREFLADADWLSNNTFITCISEHEPADNDGRLSMWRGYGDGNDGVAIVLKPGPILAGGTSSVTLSPVHYGDEHEFLSRVDVLSRNLTRNADFVRAMGVSKVEQRLRAVIRFAVLCLKHPGFREEAEWRILHTTGFEQEAGLGRGTDQNGAPIRILRLAATQEADLSPAALVDRIIVGPMDDARQRQKADELVEAMSSAGIGDARSRVRLSSIPFRDKR